MKSLMERIFFFYKSVLQYENTDLQQKARQYVPLEELEIAAERKLRKIQLQSKLKQEVESVTIQDLLLMELVSWYKTSFFSWVDTPSCIGCKGQTAFYNSTVDNGLVVELYSCKKCDALTKFSRFNDPYKLLETRKGRCGEWAICFTLLCRSLGFEARLVYDSTDHLWTEVYCYSEKPRWVHIDPCEGIVDAPLLYECGWGKKLTYIFGFSVDGVQDVTWRYSRLPPKEILQRRKASGISEEELIAAILNLRQERYKDFSTPKKKYFLRKTVSELVEFLWTQDKETQVSENEKIGRVSGSLAWRLQRNELGSNPECFQPYTWQLSELERDSRDFTVKYSCASDKYLKIVGNKKIEIKGWKNGLFENESIFRKEESDWRITYLAREESANEGSMKFKFDVSPSGLTVDTISITCRSAVFENGDVVCTLCGGEVRSQVPTGENVRTFTTTDLKGLQAFTIEMKVSGGTGPQAWQHAQLFRQPMTEYEQYPLEINVKLKE
ncbi:peptide-N(4)-(N-acetyl-beta-glucosaminyl)asparagine amidase [Hetaerina americana]|uniref:peptide-N(4)-(N-acetyl-beta- glucosaminyl)asparagine amidase n=1 Tax=Hetaerina americana TaxID=62018 RepID=UPI003A7F5B34